MGKTHLQQAKHTALTFDRRGVGKKNMKTMPQSAQCSQKALVGRESRHCSSGANNGTGQA